MTGQRMSKTINIACGAKATLQADGPAKLTFQGYSGDQVNLQDYGFDYPVVYNVAGIETSQKIPILYNHDDLVGHTTSIRKVENGSAVRGKGLASIPGDSNNKIVSGIQNGFPWQASMGLKVEYSRDNIQLHEKSVTVNNREFKGPVYVVNKSSLREMTVTPLGRDSNTSFEFLNQERRMEIKNAVKAGEDKTTPTPPTDSTPPTDKVGNSAPKDKAPVDPPAPEKVENTPAPVPPVHSGGMDPIVRRGMKLLNRYPGKWEMIEKGLDNGWDDEAIENSIKLEDLNNGLPKPPSPGIKKGENFENQLHVNMAMSFGSSPEYLAKKFPKELVDNADSRPQMGIQELLVNAANVSGGNFYGYSDPEAVCKFLKNTGYSTFDLPDFFRKVSDTMKDERWEINPPFAPTVCKEGNNKDFRKTERMRITGGDMWNPVADDGKLELFSTGGQKKYETSLRTYGSLFTMTREEIINDDMGALSDMMDIMVEGAMMIPDYQLGKLMIDQAPSAGTFWVDDDNSFDNTALTRPNLSTAYNAIRQYTEVKERVNWNVMLNERWTLIVSPNLEETAWELLKQDRIVNDTTANTKTGDKNYWFGRMDIKTFAQMANTSAFTSGSKFVGNTTWILWPSSLRFAPYEITYLRGQKRPVVESVDLPATLLGFGTRGYWDVKVNERERTATARYTATA
jgi:hypothetical protein